MDGDKKFNQLLQNALQNVQTNSSLPAIVSVGSVAFFQPQSFVWYQTYYSFYVPIMIAKDDKVILDESRYTDYNITNSIDVNDVKFKKYPFNGYNRFSIVKILISFIFTLEIPATTILHLFITNSEFYVF